VGTLAGSPTPNWDTWVTQTVDANLIAGANTIKLVATTVNGGPNLDYVDVAIAGPPPTVVQAEDCTISQGLVESNHLNFTGTGFVNGDNVVGSYIECTSPAAATTLVVRYANGTTTARPMDVTVNGVSIGTLAGSPTADWDTWIDGTFSATIPAGALIRLTATTVNGGPNLDKLTLS
jgi:hypothetical protein